MATGLRLMMSPYNTCPYNFGLQRGQMRGKINYNSFPAISVYDCTCVMKLDVSSRKASKEQITVNTTQYTLLSKLHSAKIDGVWKGTTITTGHYESHHFLHDVDGTRRGFFQHQKLSTPKMFNTNILSKYLVSCGSLNLELCLLFAATRGLIFFAAVIFKVLLKQYRLFFSIRL